MCRGPLRRLRRPTTAGRPSDFNSHRRPHSSPSGRACRPPGIGTRAGVSSNLSGGRRRRQKWRRRAWRGVHGGGPVVAHRRTTVGVGGGVPYDAQRDAGVQHGVNETVAQTVPRDPRGDAGRLGQSFRIRVAGLMSRDIADTPTPGGAHECRWLRHQRRRRRGLQGGRGGESSWGASRSWLYELLARCRAEGDGGLQPRSKRPTGHRQGCRRVLRTGWRCARRWPIKAWTPGRTRSTTTCRVGDVGGAVGGDDLAGAVPTRFTVPQPTSGAQRVAAVPDRGFQPLVRDRLVVRAWASTRAPPFWPAAPRRPVSSLRACASGWSRGR
jgi:hypothetical protein